VQRDNQDATAYPTLIIAGFYVGDRPADDTARVRMLPPDVRAAWSGPDFRPDVSDKHRPPSGSSNRDTDGRPGNLFE